MRTLILDFDGTIADTSAAILASVRKTHEKLGLPAPDDEKVRGTIGLPLRSALATSTGSDDEALLDKCVEVYRSLFDDTADGSVVLYPGVKETLQALKEEGVKLAIASGRSRASLLSQLEKMEILPLFDMVVGAEDVAEPKPAPEMVNKILNELGTEPRETLVVGDTTYDILMGQAAGTITCGVTYGNHPTEQIIAVHPNYLIDLFHDAATIVLKKL